jgi:Holliday junction resolvase RusA-like endonuclease
VNLHLPLTPPLRTLSFFVPGEPQSKGRPRGVVSPKTGRVMMYTPSDTRAYERDVHVRALEARAFSKWPRRAPDDRFALRLELFFSTGRRRDVDNVCKAVIDGMQGAVFEDDWQVVSLAVRRFLKSRNPGVRVYVSRAAEAFDDGR